MPVFFVCGCVYALGLQLYMNYYLFIVNLSCESIYIVCVQCVCVCVHTYILITMHCSPLTHTTVISGVSKQDLQAGMARRSGSGGQHQLGEAGTGPAA